MIEITVNNQNHRLSEATTVDALLVHLQLQGKRIAVEMNGEIVPKGLHASTVVKHGDVLEIVIAVGGG